MFFSDISERNNDYFDIPTSEGGEWGVVTFFVLEVPDYESAMLIYEGCPKSLASYFFKNRKMMLERYPAVVI